MIASLPMYWRAENAQIWCELWRLVQAELPNLPDLLPPEDLPDDWTAHWLSPDLGLSMTCGLPLRTRLKGRVTYVGTLDFGLDAPAGYYYSVMIRRGDTSLDEGRLRLAYNVDDSQSGWAAKDDAIAKDLNIQSYVKTGSHAATLAAVAGGRADIAFLDAVTWQLLRQFDPNAQHVIVAGRTQPVPGLPLITALGNDPISLRHALQSALQKFRPPDPMLIGGQPQIIVFDEAAYYDLSIPSPAPVT